MSRRGMLLIVMGGLIFVLAGAALGARQAGFNGTAVIITVGMLCGPGVAAAALVGACALLGTQPVEIHER